MSRIIPSVVNIFSPQSVAKILEAKKDIEYVRNFCDFRKVLGL